MSRSEAAPATVGGMRHVSPRIDAEWRLASMTAIRQYPDMGEKQKATFYIDSEVLQVARVQAARTGKRDSDVVEAALRAYLGFDLRDKMAAQNADLSDEEVMQMVVEEVRAYRRERAARGS